MPHMSHHWSHYVFYLLCPHFPSHVHRHSDSLGRVYRGDVLISARGVTAPTGVGVGYVSDGASPRWPPWAECTSTPLLGKRRTAISFDPVARANLLMLVLQCVRNWHLAVVDRNRFTNESPQVNPLASRVDACLSVMRLDHDHGRTNLRLRSMSMSLICLSR